MNDKFSLEMGFGGNWKLERDFSNLQLAKNYGKDRYPQNDWRVINRRNGAVVYTNDPMDSIQQDASLELKRFADRAMWMDNRDNPQRWQTRPNTVAARQRRAAQLIPSGFNFVSDKPKKPMPKVNWKSEGF